MLALARSYTATRSFDGGARPAQEPGGNLVAVTLCRYERDGDGLRLDTARTVRGNVSTVIDAVRALPEPRLSELCTLVARPWYRLAFDLDGRPSESIDLDMNCGLAWSDVDVKADDLTVPLDTFAELNRAQGGHLDPTPALESPQWTELCLWCQAFRSVQNAAVRCHGGGA